MHDGELLLKAVIRTQGKEQAACRALVDYLLEHLPERREAFRLDVHFRTRGGSVELCRAIVGTVPMVRVQVRRHLGRGHARIMTSVFRATDADAWQVLCACFTVFRN